MPSNGRTSGYFAAAILAISAARVFASGEPPAVGGVNLPPPNRAAKEVLVRANGLPATKMQEDQNSFSRAIVESGFAMTPQQIEQFKTVWQASALAAATGPRPEAKSSLVRVSLSPGSLPPPLLVGAGFVSALVFTDSSGAPWPITSETLGNDMFFSMSVPKAGDNNILLVAPIKLGADTNVAVTLKDLPVPLVFRLKSDQKQVDYRVSIVIERDGPNAKLPVFVAGPNPATTTPELLNALAGVLPGKSAEQGTVDLPDTEVWRNGAQMYLRSKYTLVSPSWSSQASAQGYTAWNLLWTPTLLVSVNGQLREVHVSEKDRSK